MHSLCILAFFYDGRRKQFLLFGYEVYRLRWSIAIGIVKTYFIQSILGETREQRKESFEHHMSALLTKHLVPVRPHKAVKNNGLR